jgi:polar amino acid transport system substrate-binding protein
MTIPSANLDAVRKQLAPSGTMRVGLNMSNFLLTRREPNGEAAGIAVDLGTEIARRLGVPVKFFQYERPGLVADAAQKDEWDVAFLGAEPQRAEQIAFSPAYVEIEATYLVPPGSPITSIDQVDRAGVRVAVSGGSAYDLYLKRNLKHASLTQSKSVDASYDDFISGKFDALAGLRPRLVTDADRLPGSRLLEGRFTAVQQAVGTPRGRGGDDGARYLAAFVEEVKASGAVAQAIERNKVRGLTVAAAA